MQRVAVLAGLDTPSEALDFALGVAEEKLKSYQGNVDSLLKFRAGSNGFRGTSRSTEKILAETLRKDHNRWAKISPKSKSFSSSQN